MARILHIVSTWDPAGDTVRCVAELNKYSKHTHVLVVRFHHPYQKQYQFIEAKNINLSYPQVESLADLTDCFVYHFTGWEKGYGIRHLGKPIGFRNCTAYWNADTKKFFATEHTGPGDLSRYKLIGTNHLGAEDFLGPCQFLPSLMPLDTPMYQPDYSWRAPCVSFIKDAERLSRYCYEASRQNLADKPHKEIMAVRRQHVSIVVDNVSDGHYGLAGLEAMALALPCVVWNHHKTKRQLRCISNEDPPGMIEVSNEVEDAVQAIRINLQPSEIHRKHIRQWMDDKYNSERLIKMFWDRYFDRLLDA